MDHQEQQDSDYFDYLCEAHLFDYHFPFLNPYSYEFLQYRQQVDNEDEALALECT